MSENIEKKTTNSQVMQLQQLISAPLIATLEADAMTTQSYINFLSKVAFESDGNGNLGKLRTFSFQYMQSDSKGKTLKTVEIPVISLIPIPLLQIKEATFDFEIKILDAISETNEENFSFEDNVDNKSENKMSMRASLAPQSGNSKNQKDQSLSSNMKVKVIMQQADMPSGLSNLLTLSANNMVIEDSEKEQNQE